jgi:small-conductance mechanosensitive channel
MKNAMMAPLIYWKHLDKIKGDHISTGSMALTLLLFYLVLFSAVLSLFFNFFLPIYTVLLFIFLFYIMFQVIIVARKPSDYIPLTTIYLIRTLAWSIGVPKGLWMFIKNKWYR